MVDSETRVNRKNTTAFVAVKPTDIALTPRTKIKSASGGYVFHDDTARDTQTFRIIELGMQTAPPVVITQDGSQREVRFWLLGEWDAVCAVGDWWEAEDGRFWQIGDLIRENGYETRALVTERGQ